MRHLSDLFTRRAGRRAPAGSTLTRRRSRPLRLERLEDRTVPAPAVLDPNLGVRAVVGGLVTPTTMAFLGDNDFLVLEKNTGKVQHVINGVLAGTALDLPVNFASERGLLGIALSPDFQDDHNVFLYWTESSTGQDTNVLANTPLLGNRVDRFVWNGSTLTFDRNLIRLRALQPANPPHETREFGNHDGGQIHFGPDGKLYIIIGDNGRRGWMQNLVDGPFGDGSPDDQFGGPEPDDAHLTGVALRLNPDGTTPADNPFFDVGPQIADDIRGRVGDNIADQVGRNIQKLFAYGIRNSFGFAFDPFTGKLWENENGDDSFDEINRIEPGHNGGWIQIMGPVARINEFKGIETTPRFFGLQQNRWPPTNIADTPEEALDRLFILPGAHYGDPEFSWRYAVPPAGLGFMAGSALGEEYVGSLFSGSAIPTLPSGGGQIFRFVLNDDRTEFVLGPNNNRDNENKVALNFDKFDLHGSEDLLFGTGFGITTDIQTGPDGNLFVVSLTDGKVYEIFRKDDSTAFRQTNLVSDIAHPPGGDPELVDTNLKNPWGVSFSAGSPFWVSDQRTGVSTVYAGDVTQPDGTVSAITVARPPVTIPQSATPPAGPTGQVFNGTSDFKLSNGRPAVFIFANLDGSISAWNGGNQAEQKVKTTPAVYTGLAIGSNDSGNFLYAANSRAGTIDVFDKDFKPATLDGNFEDPDLPPGTPYRPFNVQNLDGTLYVAYEKVVTFIKPDGTVGTDREHDGIVDAFDTDGHFLRRVVSGGVNAPWGLALAPADFGKFSNALLVGNFGLGDGKINAYDPDTGQFLGYVTDAKGDPIVLERLWALAFGNGVRAGDPGALYFTAGINNEQDGLFGSIRFVGA